MSGILKVFKLCMQPSLRIMCDGCVMTGRGSADCGSWCCFPFRTNVFYCWI